MHDQNCQRAPLKTVLIESPKPLLLHTSRELKYKVKCVVPKGFTNAAVVTRCICRIYRRTLPGRERMNAPTGTLPFKKPLPNIS